MGVVNEIRCSAQITTHSKRIYRIYIKMDRVSIINLCLFWYRLYASTSCPLIHKQNIDASTYVRNATPNNEHQPQNLIYCHSIENATRTAHSLEPSNKEYFSMINLNTCTSYVLHFIRKFEAYEFCLFFFLSKIGYLSPRMFEILFASNLFFLFYLWIKNKQYRIA